MIAQATLRCIVNDGMILLVTDLHFVY